MAPEKRKIEGDATVHYVPPRRRRARPKPKLQPPLTPMIDVTFQLLLFFLLTTTFRQQEGQLPSTLPKKGGDSPGIQVPLQAVRIVLRPTGEDRAGCIYEVTGQNIAIDTPQKLFQMLVSKRNETSAEVPIVIQPRSDVRWQYVVEAFNQAIRAQMKNIAFATAG